MQKINDLLFARKDKDGKTIWMKCGLLITKDNGKLSVKVDAIPVGFDGWFAVGSDDKDKPFEDKAF